MAAIVGLDDAAVAELCRQVAAETHEIIAPANFNSIGQVVVAGQKMAVETVAQRAKAQGAKLAVLIPVSVPSHCELMKPAAERLAELLATIKINNPGLPVVNNADVSIYESAQQIRDGLVKQLYMPVRWVETIQLMLNAGVTEIENVGLEKY
jgi:[acyl-carrier-protein] S-malonyltransferase